MEECVTVPMVCDVIDSYTKATSAEESSEKE